MSWVTPTRCRTSIISIAYKLWYRFQGKSMPEPIKAWLLVPHIFKRFLKLWRSFRSTKTTIDPELRVMICIVVAKQNQCSYCIGLHTSALLAMAGEKGVDTLNSKISKLDNFESCSEFTQLEKLVFSYAIQVSNQAYNIDKSITDGLKSALSTQQIVEITALIAFQNMSSRFNSALALQ